MKPQELRKKSKEELEKILKEKREHLQKLKFDLSLGKLKNVKEIGQTKKDIARILTILSELKNNPLRKEENIKNRGFLKSEPEAQKGARAKARERASD
jgi:large subunit ribosomal protein L29